MVLERVFDVGIWKDERGRFAAEFESYALEVAVSSLVLELALKGLGQLTSSQPTPAPFYPQTPSQ
jgi:hypothetical protein